MEEKDRQVSDQIASELDMHLPEGISDKEMIMHIADRVEQLLKRDPDLLMSYLYRLDVEEKRIVEAVDTSVMPIHVTFANLIWERQKQRLATKKKYRQGPIEGWEF